MHIREFLGRLKVQLRPKRLYLGYQARRYARRSEPEIQLLPYVVPPGCTAIDGGANKGVYSWWLSRLCAHVHAFEPNPDMYDSVRRAVPKNVTVHQLALSDRAGVSRFCLPTDHGKLLHTRGSLHAVADQESRWFDVQTARIDDFTYENLGFIKLDLEGAELACLRGAMRTLQEHRPVVLAEATGVGGSSPEELIGCLLDLGYEVFPLDGSRLEYHGRDPGAIQVGRNCLFMPNLAQSQVVRLARSA